MSSVIISAEVKKSKSIDMESIYGLYILNNERIFIKVLSKDQFSIFGEILSEYGSGEIYWFSEDSFADIKEHENLVALL